MKTDRINIHPVEVAVSSKKLIFLPPDFGTKLLPTIMESDSRWP